MGLDKIDAGLKFAPNPKQRPLHGAKRPAAWSFDHQLGLWTQASFQAAEIEAKGEKTTGSRLNNSS